MLLGFKALHGPHTGINLGDILHQLLKERGFLLSITIDNVTNNETLIRSNDNVYASGETKTTLAPNKIIYHG